MAGVIRLDWPNYSFEDGLCGKCKQTVQVNIPNTQSYISVTARDLELETADNVTCRGATKKCGCGTAAIYEFNDKLKFVVASKRTETLEP